MIMALASRLAFLPARRRVFDARYGHARDERLRLARVDVRA